MRFGEKLCALRKEKGLTQAELAKLAGVGLKTITNYEKAAHTPQNREVYGILRPDSRMRCRLSAQRGAMTSSLWPDSNTAIGARRAPSDC